MNQAIVLSIGYDHYIIPTKPGIAGKLLELLSEAVPAREEFDHANFDTNFRIQPRRNRVKVQMVSSRQILPPKEEDFNGPDVVELKTLPGAMRLIEGGRR